MEVVEGLETLPLERGPAAVTIGFFDGVHRGHQAVIGRTVEAARERGLVPVAITFDRHPREILMPGTQPKLLTTLERKAELIDALGIEALVVLAFTPEFAGWRPEEFVDRVLVEGLATRHVVVGSNFTFGHRAEGNLASLQEMGGDRGFDAQDVALQNVGGRRFSSTSIREALEAGDLDWPEHALGRRFAVDGRVVAGAGRGATLGYPTANLEIGPKMLLPAEGVYAGRAFTAGGSYVAAVNVGTNPTFGQEPLHVEAFLLDFEGDLRGRPITIEFWSRLRGEVRFESPEALSAQIGADVERTRELVS